MKILKVFIAVILLFVAVLVVALHSVDTSTTMFNCGNPDGLIVIETGRVIELGEKFEMFGDEVVDDNGVSEIKVYDGTIRREDMFICKVSK